MSIGAHELAPPKGATHDKKRVGRGNSAGGGTYAGKGLKGQKSRSGKPPYLGFEGGQMPIFRRMKVMRGFNNKWRVEYQPINVAVLERFDAGSDVTPESLRERGILKQLRQPVKVLAFGDLTKKLNVTAHAFSGAAREKIEKAGGTCTVLGGEPEAKDE